MRFSISTANLIFLIVIVADYFVPEATTYQLVS